MIDKRKREVLLSVRKFIDSGAASGFCAAVTWSTDYEMGDSYLEIMNLLDPYRPMKPLTFPYWFPPYMPGREKRLEIIDLELAKLGD